MSWFDEQLRYRKRKDDETFADSIDAVADAVMGRRLRESLDSREIANSAIEEILRYYHCKMKTDELPPQIKSVDAQIEYRMRPHGIMSRRVKLGNGWYHHASGAMLGTLKEDGSAVALIPGRFSGYSFLVLKTGKRIRLNRRTQSLLDEDALCFYSSLPQRPLGIGDLLRFVFAQLSVSDVVLYVGMMALATLLGLLTPIFTKLLFSSVIASGSTRVLIALAIFMLGFSVCRLLTGTFRSLVNARIGIKQNIAVQAAVMSRILSLPASFFKDYASGELTRRSQYVSAICSTLFDSIGTTGISSLFSLVYILQIFSFAPALVMPAFAVIVLTLAVTVVTALLQIGHDRKRMAVGAKTDGLTYATICGIQKIKLAGAEKRMFARWAKHYSEDAALEYNPPLFLKLSGTLTMAVSLVGTLVMFAFALANHVEIADYYAFNTAFGMVSSAFMSLAAIAAAAAGIKPMLEMAKPILETAPEITKESETITGLAGSIELNHVSFRYDETQPNVIDELSLKIGAGEFVAVVGPTGCGKSTLVRLLLGFETPQKGSIFYDRKDMRRIDLRSLRRMIGTVMQDGKLFYGDIYSNIVISAPELTLDDAWEAARVAAVDEDIRDMPMGMNTMIAEGQGGISGGQKQRLMIARAVAPKPKILIFDEATSALDNVTQKKVTEAIDALGCTRIVIAHRLSTIRHADRILYLEDGRIAEDGTYDELIAKNGRFAALVERQRIDVDAD